MKTLKQLIDNLTWYNSVEKLKEIFRKLSDTPLSSKIESGSNITLSGEGTEESPLVINASGGSGGNQDLQSVLETGSNATLAGQGMSVNFGDSGAFSIDPESPLTLQGRENGISISGQTGDVNITSTGGRVSIAPSSGQVVIPNLSPNTTPNQVLTRLPNGQVTYSDFTLGVSGTFGVPTSITVTNGIITAIS